MFKTRLISGIVLVALALLLIITGGNVLLGALCVISLIGMFELYRIFKIEKELEQYNSRDRRYGGIKEDEENV